MTAISITWNYSATNILFAVAIVQQIVGQSFTFLHCWHELKHHPKWLVDYSKRKLESATTTSPSTPILVEEENLTSTFVDLERPLGRKAEKERLKKKKGRDQIYDNMTTPTSLLLEKYIEEKKEMECRRKEFQERIIIQEQEKITIEQAKIRQRDEQEEERIMLQDTTGMPPMLENYYKGRQMEILAKQMGRIKFKKK
ncbi:hypothetical protein ACE6H2_011550 [Prunus campanulata]